LYWSICSVRFLPLQQPKTSYNISGGEQDTTNLRMELTAACVALEAIDEGHIVTIYSDASYLVNCMRRGCYKKWRENGWFNHRNEPVANRDLWERLLQATQRHQEVRWRKVKGHSKTQGPPQERERPSRRARRGSQE